MTEPSDSDAPSLRHLLWRLAVGLFTLLVGVALLGLTLRSPLEAVSAWFVAKGGLPGVFLLVLLVDTLPLTHEPVLFLGWSGGLGFVPVWLTGGLASVLAGINGWFLGRWLGRAPWLQDVMHRYRIAPFLRRYGAGAVAVAALTPFPYAVATWAAGAARIPFHAVLLGSLMRVPKVLFYLSLMAAGWTATS